uniref:P/Homo B domain-containing protein n=1 Tax=Ditylenchus dipsaci TaxID=166011 RepID=A0A915DJ02_9BILA
MTFLLLLSHFTASFPPTKMMTLYRKRIPQATAPSLLPRCSAGANPRPRLLLAGRRFGHITFLRLLLLLCGYIFVCLLLFVDPTSALVTDASSSLAQTTRSRETDNDDLFTEEDETHFIASGPKKTKFFTNRWALRIEGGEKEDADILAQKYGFNNLGPVFEGGEFYLLQPAYISREENVLWLEQQVAKKRVKRDFLPIKIKKRSPASNIRVSSRQPPTHNSIAEDNDRLQQQLYAESIRNKVFHRQHQQSRAAIWSTKRSNVEEMWYLHRSNDIDGEMDHNVKEAWNLGYTGRGIVLTILDDGLERTHPDISPNYDADASYDVNDRDDDPTPRYSTLMKTGMGPVGIAFNARIGGIRMLDGDVTDAVEATSLSHNFQHIDIYSASWGQMTMAGQLMGGSSRQGFHIIWASGNGGKDADSSTERGNIPWYSEACSSTLATAYSSGATGEKMIVTTDLHHSCTKSHTGTSASAPLAAGIAALTLEANPTLTWRDLQHIVVRTARPVNLRAGDWKLSGVGRNVSHSFGYGLLDAGAMVRLAQVWRNVPRQKKCRASYPAPYKTIPHGNRLHLQIYTNGCAGDRNTQVKYLEHVQAIVTLSAPKRGDIQIYLTSPKGTRSTLLAKRARDTSRTGFRDWAFMTLTIGGNLPTGHGPWRSTMTAGMTQNY